MLVGQKFEARRRSLVKWTVEQSPCTRRCPQVGFSIAMRITSFLIAVAVHAGGGRCSPTCARPICGAKPRARQEAPKRPPSEGGAAEAGSGGAARRGGRRRAG